MAQETKPSGKSVRIRMSDLAALAGVSKSTVSRALADSPMIPAETKERIAALAKEHSYRINKRARHFYSKETLTIAVLIPDTKEKDWRLSDPFFLELLGSIADALNSDSHELLLAKTSMTIKDWVDDHVKRGTCDGVILVGQGAHKEDVNALVDGKTPFIVWGGKLEDQKYCTVGTDNVIGGRKAAEHLIKKGRKRIAFFGERRLPEVELRFKGFQSALKEAGLEFSEDLYVAAPFSADPSYRAVVKFLDSGKVFDGVFACSDVIGMAVIRALRERNIEIPQDVSLVGYDDIVLSEHYSPPLTTLRQDCQHGGKELVARLLKIIEGEHVTPLIMDPVLVERAST